MGEWKSFAVNAASTIIGWVRKTGRNIEQKEIDEACLHDSSRSNTYNR
jgi:hypothetical protein